MAKIVHPDELHLIHLLLYGTTLTVRRGSYTTSSFSSTVGTPQGDGLSPVLFVCYLEAALKDCRSQLPPRPASDSLIPHETGYADDINFYSTILERLQIALPIIARTLTTWSLNVNKANMEWVELVSGGNWRATKQLGSLLGDTEDVMRRISLASQAYGRMCSMWMRTKHVSEKRRLRLYNAIVLPTLLYNSETWGVTKIIMGKADCFNRRQLRHLLGIRYPDRITNHDPYARCKTDPVSSIINRQCLRLAGHIFRLGEDTPPWLAMESNLSADSPGVRGRPKTTIATILKSQLAELGIRFNNFNDLARPPLLLPTRKPGGNAPDRHSSSILLFYKGSKTACGFSQGALDKLIIRQGYQAWRQPAGSQLEASSSSQRQEMIKRKSRIGN